MYFLCPFKCEAKQKELQDVVFPILQAANSYH